MAGNVISFQKEKRLSFGVLVAEVARFEGSCHILLYGGAKPHIGCTVLAQPRPSLADTRKRSSTACVLNVAGHKDEVLCRHVAETVAAGQRPCDGLQRRLSRGSNLCRPAGRGAGGLPASWRQKSARR